MKSRLLSLLALIIVIFVFASGIFTCITEGVIWLVTLDFNSPNISIFGQIIVKYGTWLITFFLVGILFTILCYFLGEFFKLVILRKKKRYKYIPIIVGGIGGILGLLIYYISPELLFNTTNPFVAMAIGIVSGLASTGGNEIVKKILKKEDQKDGRNL